MSLIDRLAFAPCLALALIACGAPQRAGAGGTPTGDERRLAIERLAAEDARCAAGPDVLFRSHTVRAADLGGVSPRSLADGLAAEALGLEPRPYRLMGLPKVSIVLDGQDGSSTVWICTSKKWVRHSFQVGSASTEQSRDPAVLRKLARQDCRVNLAAMVAPGTLKVETVTMPDGQLKQAVVETQSVNDTVLPIVYSDLEWEGMALVHVGCWFDRGDF